MHWMWAFLNCYWYKNKTYKWFVRAEYTHQCSTCWNPNNTNAYLPTVIKGITLLTIVFNVDELRSTLCYAFVRRTGQGVWRTMVVLLGPRAYHGCVTVDSLIYLVGGFDGMDYFNSVRCFNPIDKEWLEVAPMNARRYNLHVSTLLINSK